MKIIDYIKMSIKNLMRKTIRTILTMISVAIGTFAIVIMVSLGIGINVSYEKQVMEMGSLTTIEVSQYNYSEKMEEYVPVKPTTINDETIKTLSKIPHVRAVTPITYQSFLIKYKKYNSYMQVLGVDFSTLDSFDFPKIVEGPASEEGYDLSKGVLIGSDSLYFYSRNGENPQIDYYKDKLKYYITKYEDDEEKKYEVDLKIIGTFETTNSEYDWNVYMDINALNKLLKDNEEALTKEQRKKLRHPEYESAKVSVDNINYVEEVQKAVKELGYGAYSLGDMLSTMQETGKTLQLVLGGIGGISLFIAAIGIANTMVMSTYERTKEIGIMKVLGCKGNDIRKLFLLEAAIIGFLGGIVGIILSYVASFLLNKYGATFMSEFSAGGENAVISVIPVWLTISSLVFSFVIGLLSGYFPARRATKIKALEALKTE